MFTERSEPIMLITCWYLCFPVLTFDITHNLAPPPPQNRSQSRASFRKYHKGGKTDCRESEVSWPYGWDLLCKVSFDTAAMDGTDSLLSIVAGGPNQTAWWC